MAGLSSNFEPSFYKPSCVFPSPPFDSPLSSKLLVRSNGIELNNSILPILYIKVHCITIFDIPFDWHRAHQIFFFASFICLWNFFRSSSNTFSVSILTNFWKSIVWQPRSRLFLAGCLRVENGVDCVPGVDREVLKLNIFIRILHSRYLTAVWFC